MSGRGAAESQRGSVALVGAGPGDPGLMTLRGYRALAHADVVLYDALSNPSLLRFAPQAEHVCVGKHGGSPIWSQEEINAEMLRQARRGRRVVRLKGGDPAVFARSAEEVDALRDGGIAVEIIPGITAALAAGSYAGIPLTHRGWASAVALVTGHEEPDKDISSLDWSALARFPGTLVIYMGVTTVQRWTEALLAGGKPAATPVAIVRRCSFPDQQVIQTTLGEVASRLTPASTMRPPVIVIVGEVAKFATTERGFDPRPFVGQRILLTRPEEQAREDRSLFEEAGAEVFFQPAICVSPLDDFALLDDAIDRRMDYRWIVFSSRNGVRFFFQRLFQRGLDARSLGGLLVGAVGSETAAALQSYGIRADAIPAEYDAEHLAAQIARWERGGGERGLASEKRVGVLFPQASRGKETLVRELMAAGMEVTPVVCYRHEDLLQPSDEIRGRLEGGEIDWTTVTSSAIARSLVRMFPVGLRHTKLVSLSPLTTHTLKTLGYPPAAEAKQATMAGVFAAMVEYLSPPSSSSPGPRADANSIASSSLESSG